MIHITTENNGNVIWSKKTFRRPNVNMVNTRTVQTQMPPNAIVATRGGILLNFCALDAMR